MQLLVFARVQMMSRIALLGFSKVPTGVGNTVGNKGGVLVSLKIDSRRVCFICSHLAAHEGQKFREMRKMNAMGLFFFFFFVGVFCLFVFCVLIFFSFLKFRNPKNWQSSLFFRPPSLPSSHYLVPLFPVFSLSLFPKLYP